MPKIKKGDLVQVITGAKQDRGGDRGKQGKVLSVDFEKNRVIVEGVNISNVALVDPSTKKPTRMGSKVESVTKGGKSKTVRTRVSVKSGKEI
jgi:large subunit ribosomal protein L24